MKAIRKVEISFRLNGLIKVNFKVNMKDKENIKNPAIKLAIAAP